jgi:polyisoprenoid-binding protein YceI
MAIYWKMDNVHSEMQFQVTYQGMINLSACFKQMTLELETESADFLTMKRVVFTAKTDAIETQQASQYRCQNQINGLNSEEHPQVHFEGIDWTIHGASVLLQGNLTIHGITQPLTVAIIPKGIFADPFTGIKAGFKAEAIISRNAFHLNWPGVWEHGREVIGDAITIRADILLTGKVK